ncbi:MAG: tetratricopeptide repeat protein, partial [Beijerinckiaceae bacterium]
MGRLQDRFGQPVTASSRAAIDAYVEGMDILLSAWPGADAHFDAALAADPDFALAHVARGRVLQMQGKGEAAAAAVSAANALVERLDDRERSHIHAVSLAIAGDGAGALDALKQHIRDWPRDAFVLSLTTGVYGLLGFSGARDHHEQQRDLLDSIAGHWDGDWWFLGYRGWAHAETGNAEFGAPLIEESLALRRANGNAAHGRAHAFYELGDAAGGAAFLDNWLPDYAANGSLYPHLSWHLALFALRLGDAAKAVALYDGRIDPALGKQPPFFAIIDSGAFNWRCLLRDVE